jgi:hypothetical protein
MSLILRFRTFLKGRTMRLDGREWAKTAGGKSPMLNEALRAPAAVSDRGQSRQFCLFPRQS